MLIGIGALIMIFAGCDTVVKERGNFAYYADSRFCSGCNACIEPCPRKAITAFIVIGDQGDTLKRIVIDPEKCIGCGQCFIECRYLAIKKEYKNNR